MLHGCEFRDTLQPQKAPHASSWQTEVLFCEGEDAKPKKEDSPASMGCSPLDIPHWLQLPKMREFDYKPRRDFQL